MSRNTSLLDAKNASPSNLTPAPLTGPSSAVVFAFQGLQPPSNLYVNVDDQLIISAATSQTAEVVTINARLLMPNGRVEDMQFQIRPANTRVVLKQSFPLAEGFLLSVSASAAVAVTRGQTFVRVSLQRSASGAGQPAYVLLADYVTTQAVPGYPNGRILSPTEGPGYIYGVSVGNPSAGVGWQIANPTNARWKIRSFEATLTTNATAGNRTPQVTIADLGGGVFLGPGIASIPASTSAIVSGFACTPYAAASVGEFVVPIPPDCFLPGPPTVSAYLAVSAVGTLGTDQWSNIRVLVEEWLDNV